MDDMVLFLAKREVDTSPGTSVNTAYDTGYWKTVIHEGSPTTWYRYREDMLEASRNWPKVLFLLEGQGQERDDDWKEYYIDGKLQRLEPTTVWPDFDPARMEDPENVKAHLVSG